MRLVIDTPGLYRVFVEPGQKTIIYGYYGSDWTISIPTLIDPKRFQQDGPTDTPSA